MTDTTQLTDIRADNATAWGSFIGSHQSMVYDLAHKLMMDQWQFEELVGVGNLALCEAGREFVAATYDCRFSTFAYTRIRRAMVSFQRTECGATEWDARICKQTRDEMDRLRQQFAELEIEREPTAEDLAMVCSKGPIDDADVRRFAARLQGTPRFVQLELNTQSLATAGDDDSWTDTLSPATRHVWFGLLEQQDSTGNASLSVEAHRNNISRDEICHRVSLALKQWWMAHHAVA